MDLKEQNSRTSSSKTASDIAPDTTSNTAVVVGVTPKLSKSPDILKMDIDCCEEAFDYLPFKDLIGVGSTCKRLNQVVSYILRQNFSAAVLRCEQDGIYITNNESGGKMKFFHEFIHKFRLVDINSFQYILHVQPKFRRIRQIDFERMELSTVHLECLKEIFAKIEFLRIVECKLDGNFDDSLLSMCPNLKRLTLFQTNVNDSNIIGDSNDWLHRKYPTLEQFQLNTNRKFDGIGELKAFLELNPNIKKLQIHQRHIKGFEDLWMSANVQLDEFALVTTSIDTNLCSLLNNLHASGFYKRLKLECIFKISQDTVDQLAALKRLIELLSFFRMDSVELSALIDLEKLYIGRSREIVDFHALPSTL